MVAVYYYTERWAAINDPRLATAYDLGRLATLLLGVWSLFDLSNQSPTSSRGYLQLDQDLRGVIRPRICNRYESAPHRRPYEVNRKRFSPPLSADGATPSYCQASGLCPKEEWCTLVKGCERWDPMSVSRTMGPSSIFVATRLQERHDVSLCQPQQMSAREVEWQLGDWAAMKSAAPARRPLCRDGFATEWRREAFLESVEDFVMRVDANVEASRFAASSTSYCGGQHAWEYSNKMLYGELVDREGRTLEQIPVNSTDAFPVSRWLKAAGIADLSMHSNATTMKRGKIYRPRYRHEGVVLEVTFEYSNFQNGHLSFFEALIGRITCDKPAPLSYKIFVQQVPGSKYQLEELLTEERTCELNCPEQAENDNRNTGSSGGANMNPAQCCGTSRIVHRLHGLLFKFDHTGAVGRFSFTAIPHHLVYALGYITIWKNVLDLVWSLGFPWFGLPDYNDEVYSKLTKRD